MGPSEGPDMDKIPLTDDEIARLKRREAEILARIERLKSTMNETKAIDTLAFKSKLYREAQDELRRVQDKLAGLDGE
jgi:flagellar biosynthesis regulator FlaF